MIDPRLSSLRARIPRRHDPNQKPPALLLQHQRPPRIPLTTVAAPVLVARAQHLVVDDDPDAFGAMPSFAHPAINYGHLHGLQGLGSEPGAGTEGPPAGRYAHLAEEAFAAGWQADGGDVGQGLGGAVQTKDGDVETVGLGGEFEVRVDLYMENN